MPRSSPSSGLQRQTADEARKSTAGHKPIDALVSFRMLVLQSLYKLSDEQIEYQVRDRLSFTRFLGLGFKSRIPDGTTLWLFREKLPRPVCSTSCSSGSVSIWKPAATSHAVARWWTPQS